MRVWVEAARPRTLPAAVVPVLVGTATAGRVVWLRFAAALVTSLGLQVAVNYANDYFDAVRGVDTPDRVGPRRAVAAGLVRPAQMKVAIAVALAVAAAAGLALTIAVGPELLLVGAASIAAALAYSGGPRPYASAGLGELFVFAFFGLVATMGSAYVQIEEIPLLSFVAAIPVGLLATAILVVNNLRDIPTDSATGKRTLAVRLGPRRTRLLYGALLTGAAACVVPLAFVAPHEPRALALLVVFAPVPGLIRGARHAQGAELVPLLGRTAALHLLFGVAASVLLWR
ncbi:MAG TPA: 1,4-dihydroxy-2-naphthoate polyprenyltransferase [Actinomycetota bacterium]|nr:1,4-dihydroxy-2-naphthoate polyprenyltransferase [Actinomycetota bacterium]